MRIGFDAKRIVANGTGLGSYGRTLVNALSALDSGDELLLYAPDGGSEALRTQVEQRGNVRFVFPGKSSLPGYKQYWRSHGIVSQLVADSVDVYHGLSGELPVGIRQKGIKTIVTIHDLIFLRHPEYYHWIDTKIYARKFRQALCEADRIVAISECTKRDILHYGDFPSDRIDVVYQSCGLRFSQHVSESKLQEVHARYDLPACYMLCVGTIEERKNALLAVQALRYLPREMSLVMVGRATPYQKVLDDFISREGLTGRVRFLHGVPNDDLPAIYQLGDVFVYPSRYEGFGIPIVEAIQSGLPVVAATGSCLEEAGGPDSLYVDPDDAEGMAHAVERAVGERAVRVPRSRDYVCRFENQDVAALMLLEYEKLFERK